MNGIDGLTMGVHTPVGYRMGETARVTRQRRAQIGQSLSPFSFALPGGGSFLDPGRIRDLGAKVAAAVQEGRSFLDRVGRLPDPWRTEIPKLMEAHDQLVTLIKLMEKDINEGTVTATDGNWADRWRRGLEVGGFAKLVADVEAGKFQSAKTVVETRIVEVEKENLIRTVLIGAGVAVGIGGLVWALS